MLDSPVAYGGQNILSRMPDQPKRAGELLRHWRQRRRLSQLDLAVKAGVCAGT